jgi:hypothetical protein
MPGQSRPKVDFYFDPLCPWAWVTSRWMCEVERQRELDLRFRLMSVAVLNELSPKGRVKTLIRHTDSWRPVRVAAAVEATRGQQGLRDFYTAFGTRYHQHGNRDRDEVLTGALGDIDAAELHYAASTGSYDSIIRASHQAAVAPVGHDVGTPIVHADDVAFFGPVLDAIPVGEEALRVFDAAIALARCPNFFELKRSRARGARVRLD